MTDWKSLAAARCPDMPADAVERLLPSMAALEAAFLPLAGQLTPEDEPALIFAILPERAK